jgi:cell division protein ZapE
MLRKPVAPVRSGLFDRLRGRAPSPTRTPVRGLYLWGGVGRGKTYLMDIFFHALPLDGKLRLHFHRFMKRVHDELKALRDRQDPLPLVAERLTENTRIICLDEFFVSDITDAMLLGGLLKALFERGVTLVTTSNIPPDELYRDGLQRARFLPAIELLKTHLEVFRMDGGVDYRLRYLDSVALYHTPLGETADDALLEAFEHVSPEPGTAGGKLEIEGRRIATRRQGDGVVWFDFATLCEGPRSQNDYIEIARLFHTVVLSDIPVLDRDREDPARRFLNLVDEFYDRHVKLILSAAVPIELLYQGERLSFEYRRTVSRLIEMQSHDYLAREHLP